MHTIRASLGKGVCKLMSTWTPVYGSHFSFKRLLEGTNVNSQASVINQFCRMQSLNKISIVNKGMNGNLKTHLRQHFLDIDSLINPFLQSQSLSRERRFHNTPNLICTPWNRSNPTIPSKKHNQPHCAAEPIREIAMCRICENLQR